MADLIGWVGSAWLLIGYVFVVRKKIIGFYLGAIGCMCWIFVGVSIGLKSQVFVNSVYFLINLYGIKKWSKK